MKTAYRAGRLFNALCLELLAALIVGSSGCVATRPGPGTAGTAISWPSFTQKDSARHEVKTQRIAARQSVRLARQQTRQVKATRRSETEQKRVETKQKRAETSAAVQLGKQDAALGKAWAKAELEHATAARKAAEAKKLQATAANTRLMLQIGAAVLILLFLLGLYLKLR